jgi:4'-phosphopantetheinyl transferase
MNIEIEDYQVHIWQANLKSLSVYPEDISKTLSSDELESADKLKFTIDREHFILRHYYLRLILGKYCNCQPHELMFRYNSCKKPYISIPEYKEILFNMSSSGDLMIVGLGWHNDIGIDIEKVHEFYNLENISADYFSLQELNYFNGESDRTKAFFKIWTRKEAIIKAMGQGLYYPLKSFCVEVSPSGDYEHMTIVNNPSESKLWRTSELNTSDGYIASLAIKSDRFKISYFHL